MRTSFENVSILSLASVDAPHRVTSEAIMTQLAPTLERLGVRRDLLENLSGIRARRWWDPGVEASGAAALAGEKAIQEAGIDRERVGVLVSTSVCRDFLEPSTACLVHEKLRLAPTCPSFDLGNACLGFVDGLAVVGAMIERGQIDYALVVNGETSRYTQESTIARLLDPSTELQTFRDNFATLTLGSGAVAMVLTHRRLAPDAPRVHGGVSLAATQHSQLCRGTKEGMTTDAHTLLLAGLELAVKTWARASAELGWTPDRHSTYAIHQVSEVHTGKMCELVGVDRSKVPTIYEELGNVGPASWPRALVKARDEGRLSKGDRVGVMGIGSGLNCAMWELTW